MKIRINYTSFQLSKGTESIKSTERAKWFFVDHNINHELVMREPILPGPKEEWIVWDESVGEVNIPIDTIQQMHKYSEYYNMKFEVHQDSISISFKG